MTEDIETIEDETTGTPATESRFMVAAQLLTHALALMVPVYGIFFM